MKQDRKEKPKKESKATKVTRQKNPDNIHLGSSNAFEETEYTGTYDTKDISDEKLDDIIGDQ